MKKFKTRYLGYLFVLTLTFLITFKVQAAYYTNNNGIELTKKEYNVILNMYNKDYVENMTQEDYDFLEDLDINNSKNLSTKVSFDVPTYDSFNPMGTVHATNAKRLTLTTSCNSNFCTVITTLMWLKKPTVRSYDLIGTRLKNTSFYNENYMTRLVENNKSVQYCDNYKVYSNGLGCSVKLPENDQDSLFIDQRIYVKPQGAIYASYQHAAKSITSSASRQYILDVAGYGAVFLFYGDAVDVYDQMGGVDTTL